MIGTFFAIYFAIIQINDKNEKQSYYLPQSNMAKKQDSGYS